MKLSSIASILLLFAIQSAFSQRINTVGIDSLLSKGYKARVFNGIALVAQGDSVLFQKCYGYENVVLKTPLSSKSRFQVASISKQFTAFGILLLQQQNKLNVKDPVKKYLPQFPFDNITIHHLLSHTSGLPNFVTTMIKDLDTTKINGNNQMSSMLASGKYPAQWAAGDKWEYSDIGYCTLASLIEKVSGQRFDKFMQDNLFKHAGMTNTTAEMYTDYRMLNHQNLSMGYISDTAKKKIDIAYELPEYRSVYYLGGFYGDGSVVTTAEDLFKWSKALEKGKIIFPASIKLATTPTILNNGTKVEVWGAGYGYGWFLYNSPFGAVMTHTGGHPGYSSRITICPETKLTLITLSNFSIERFWELDIFNELVRNYK